MTDYICEKSMAGPDEVTVSCALRRPHVPQRSALHEENVDKDLSCYNDCDFADFETKLQSHLARVEETLLLLGEIGLFTTEDIKAGTFVVLMISYNRRLFE